jgi:hypothetical protein
LIIRPPYDGEMTNPGSTAAEPTHWVRWHQAYEDPASALSLRLRLVQDGVRAALDRQPPGAGAGPGSGPGPGSGAGAGPGSGAGPIRIVSMCAGQGRDVIDVVAGHPRRADVRARLVERDPSLAAFARQRAAEAGVAAQIEVVEGDASLVRSYAGFLPADLVLVCGVFGNIGVGDIRGTVSRMPAFCALGGTVIWTRHRRPPDLTPSVREWFLEAGFEEMSFTAPAGAVLGVGCHRLVGDRDRGRGSELDPDLRLFDFVGDGSLPA